MSRACVLLGCVAVVLSPIVAAAEGLKFGDEFALLVAGPGKGLQATPAVAFGEGVYLVVWREGWHGKGGTARIYAARVTADGKLLDPGGIEVAPAAAGVQERPRVAFGGGVFLVAWQDLRNGKDYDVLGARITLAGKRPDREPLAIAAGPHSQVLPDVASDGQRFVVVWQGFEAEKNVFAGYAAAVSAEGRVGRPVETGVAPQPKIAYSGDCYLAVGSGHQPFVGTLLAVRLDAEIAPLGKPKQLITGTKEAAFSVCPVPGHGWLVVTHRSPPDPWGWGGPGAIRTALVNQAGEAANPDVVKEPAGVKERLPGWLDMGQAKTAGATWPWGPNACAYDGKQTVVAWQRHHLCGEKYTNFENCDLIAARVSGYKSLDPQGVPVAASPADEQCPALASSGDGRLLLVYERRDDSGRATIVARRLWTE